MRLNSDNSATNSRVFRAKKGVRYVAYAVGLLADKVEAYVDSVEHRGRVESWETVMFCWVS